MSNYKSDIFLCYNVVAKYCADHLKQWTMADSADKSNVLVFKYIYTRFSKIFR